MMKKNDKPQVIKMNKLYGSGLMLIALIAMISMGISTQRLNSQDLEAPVPSITIEEESGTTTSFGDELTIEDDLPPLPEKKSGEDKKTSDTIKKDESEEEIEPIGNPSNSDDGWDTWEVVEETKTETATASNKEEESATTSETLALEAPTENAPDVNAPIAVGRVKDEEGNDVTPTVAEKSAAPEENIKELDIETVESSDSKNETVVASEEETVEVAEKKNEPKVTKKEKEKKPKSKKKEKDEDKEVSTVKSEGEQPKETTSDIVAAPEAPTPPKAPEVSALDALEPPVVDSSASSGGEPSLGDLPIGTLPTEVPMAPMDRDENKEVEIAKLIRQLEEEAANKEVAKSSLVPNQMQDEINFDNVPIGAAFRLLAEQAGFNFVEPPFQDGETLSLRFQKMTPLDAFMKIAQARGFAVVTENGFTTLKRPDIALPEFYEVKKYRLKYIQPKWIIQSVANLLEITINQPADTLASFPEPSEDATSYGGSNDGNSGGGGGTSAGGTGGASANGSQNIGLPTAPRWTSSLPYDEPLHSGEGAQGGEVPFIFIDRSTSSLVVKTTKEKQKMVAQYVANVDKPEPQIMIETKVVEISMGELLEYGTDWSDALGKGITVNWEGAKVNLADVFSGGGTGTWSAFLTIPEASITLRAFQEMDKGSVMNMPRTMTRSGVPVSISSTITDATPAYQIATGTGGTGAVSTPSGFNTFTTGLTIDVVPQILDNGMIDININPTVANQVGERTIDANTQTGVPKQTIPIISSRSLTTSAVVPSGMTIMLGGIVETKNTDSSGGIPILSQIPVLGKTVFGNTNKNDSRKTLIVFVTPKVIYPDQYQKVWTNEEEWRAMIDGNRVDIQTYNDRVPEPLEIRKAIPLNNTMNQKGNSRNKQR